LAKATLPTSKNPYFQEEHYSVDVLALVAELALESTALTPTLLAAARLLAQDRWHQEKMALAEQKRQDSLAKEALADKRRVQTLRLKAKGLRLRKKEMKARIKAQQKAAQLRSARLAAKIEAEKPLPLPKVNIASVPVSAHHQALREKFGMAAGGVERDSRAPKPTWPDSS
jgi:hypothetical protein